MRWRSHKASSPAIKIYLFLLWVFQQLKSNYSFIKFLQNYFWNLWLQHICCAEVVLSFHYITIIGAVKEGEQREKAGLRDCSRNVVNDTFHFATYFLLCFSFCLKSAQKYVLLALSFYFTASLAVGGEHEQSLGNKFIHAKNLPNRINIFIYEFIFGRLEGVEKLCLH